MFFLRGCEKSEDFDYTQCDAFKSAICHIHGNL